MNEPQPIHCKVVEISPLKNAERINVIAAITARILVEIFKFFSINIPIPSKSIETPNISEDAPPPAVVTP